MELKTKLYLMSDDGDKFMGIGVVWLLEGVRDTGSLLASAKRMGMSYSKAHGMIDKAERVLGRSMIERRHGGADRKGAVLTSFAEEYLELYRRFEYDVKKFAAERYKEFEKASAELMESQ